MRKPLAKNTVLKLQNTDRTYLIDSVLGVGANSFVYSAYWEDSFGLSHPVRIKELCPAKAEIDRNDDGSLTWKTDSERDAALQHFEGEYKKHQQLSSWQDAVNSTVQYQESLLYGNGTAYMIMGTDNGKPYSEVSDANLHELFKTLLALAKTVALYHEKGLLLLDIKPENLLVIPETRELVKLFDFDSVVSEHKVTDLDTSISYSYDYAAPELRMGKRKSICKATDYYAVGSIAFSRIINRFPDADDCLRFSDWDLSENSLFSSTSPKSQRLIKAFFRKTLASHTNARYSNDQELIDALHSIAEETVPGRCFLYSARRAPLASFIGREQEQGKIHAAFTDGANIVFLRGFGGIGKTELAKAYGKRFENEYDTVCFGTFKTDTDALLRDQSFISFANVPAESTTAESALRRLSLTDPHTLLIVDDFSFSEDDSLFENLLALPCRILITTREETKDLFANQQTIRHITLGSLQTDEQWDLFSAGYRGLLTDEEKKEIENLFVTLDGHTMAIDLFSKNLRASGLSVSEAVSRFEKSGFSGISEAKIRSMKDGAKTDTIEGFFRTLFDMSNLSDDAKQALSCLALLGDIHIDKRFLCKISGSSLDVLNLELINRGWVRYIEELDEISTHSIIMRTTKDALHPSIYQIRALRKYFSDVIFDYQNGWGYDYDDVDYKDNFRFINCVIRNSDPTSDDDIGFLAYEYASLCGKYLEEWDSCFGWSIFESGTIDYFQELLLNHSYEPDVKLEIQKCQLFRTMYHLNKESDPFFKGERIVSIAKRIKQLSEAFLITLKLYLQCDKPVLSPMNFLLPVATKLDDILYQICQYHAENKDLIYEFCRALLYAQEKLIPDDEIDYDYQKKPFQQLRAVLDDPDYYNDTESPTLSEIEPKEESAVISDYHRRLAEAKDADELSIVLKDILNDDLAVPEKADLIWWQTSNIVYYLDFPRGARDREDLFDGQKAKSRIRRLQELRSSFESLYLSVLLSDVSILMYTDSHESIEDCFDVTTEPIAEDEYELWLDHWETSRYETLLEESILHLVLKEESLADSCIREYQEFAEECLSKYTEIKTDWYLDDCWEDIHFSVAVFLKMLHYLGEYRRYLDIVSWLVDFDTKHKRKRVIPILFHYSDYYPIYCLAIDAAEKTGNKATSYFFRNIINEKFEKQFHYDEDITSLY